MKGTDSFIVLLHRQGSATPRVWARLLCRARSQMPMAPHGISGCQTGLASTGLIILKTESMLCLFCQTVQPYGKVTWADPFLTDALYLVPMRPKCYMIGQRSARR